MLMSASRTPILVMSHQIATTLMVAFIVNVRKALQGMGLSVQVIIDYTLCTILDLRALI